MAPEPISPEEARKTLADIETRQSASVARLDWPLWRELVLGGAFGVLTGAHALPTPWDLVLILVCVGVILVMVRNYVSQPVWVSGYRKGRTLPVTIGFVVGWIALYFGTMVAYDLTGALWIPIGAGLLSFAAFMVFNRLWLAIWRAEMREAK